MSINHTLPLEPTDEDTVQCLFHCPSLGSDLSLWEGLCQELNAFIKNLTKDYIWHRDELLVYMPLIADSITGPFIHHLCSTTCFGDNLEDEWFIVYVLLEITKKYKNLIIQVKDNDGDFLLIEAANHLQSWATPENTENRVYIYDGHIHIIPPAISPLNTKLELAEALKFINQTPHLTQASQEIQRAILNRIGNYPDKAFEQIHKTAVNLPSDLATLLTLKPSFIAPIVDAYCNHDIIDAKFCKKLDFSDLITVQVKFTKFLYAALMHSKLINHTKPHIEMENDKKNIIGWKLLCGFQIIMNKASIKDLNTSNEYNMFLNSLKQNGYFRNNIEGSKEYNYLLEKARHYFSTVESPVSHNVTNNISELIKSNEFISVKDSLKHRTSVESLTIIEDSEDWLNIHPQELNDLLSTRYGKTMKLKNNDLVTSQEITRELSSFLKQTSDFEGIESDRNEAAQENIDFEPEQFIECIEKMLGLLSTGNNQDTESNVSNEDDLDNMSFIEDDDDDDCDRELHTKLLNNSDENLKDNRTILGNIIQSMKEEKASAGPSSNLLESIGVRKTELLDSDDD